MSSNNFLLTKKQAYDVKGTKQFTTASGVITYTARVGRVADNFHFDRVIIVTTASTFSLTITVPDGVYYGQKLLVLFEVEGGTETITTTTTTGDNGTSLTAAGGYNRFEWHGSTIGWCLTDSSAT